MLNRRTVSFNMNNQYTITLHYNKQKSENEISQARLTVELQYFLSHNLSFLIG
jgi:hypothetical protein